MTLTKFMLCIFTMSLWVWFLFIEKGFIRINERTQDYALANGIPIPVYPYSMDEILWTLGLCACGVVIGICLTLEFNLFKDLRRSAKLKLLKFMVNDQ